MVKADCKHNNVVFLIRTRSFSKNFAAQLKSALQNCLFLKGQLGYILKYLQGFLMLAFFREIGNHRHRKVNNVSLVCLMADFRSLYFLKFFEPLCKLYHTNNDVINAKTR